MRIKQRTVSVGNQRQTVELVRLKNRHKSLSRNKWVYVVRDADTKERLDPPAFTKKKGKRKFRTTVKQIKRGMKAERRDRDSGIFELGGGFL